MSPRSSHAGAVRDSLLALQSRRLRQLIVLLMAALGTFAVINLTVIDASVMLPLVVGVALLGVALWLQERQRVEEALLMVLWVMTLVVTAMIGMRSGVTDLVVLAFPCILVLAAMTLSPKPRENVVAECSPASVCRWGLR